MRLYVNTDLMAGADVSISREQAHYLRDVMRRRAGDELLVFNGRDGEWTATIADLAKKGGRLTAGRQRRPQGGTPDLQLLFAPVKRSPVDLIAQKATELGVAKLQPVFTQRTIVNRVNTERLNAIAIEAAEQSDRLTAPSVAEPQKLEQLIADWPAGRRLMFCDEAGDDPSAEWGGATGRAAPALAALAALKAADAPSDTPWAILIGPEGGFAPEERAMLRGLAFATPVTLGPRILRADTAAFAAIALWQASLGDWL